MWGNLQWKDRTKKLIREHFLVEIFQLINEEGMKGLKRHQRDGMGREEGGGFRMGNTCIPVADSF